MKPRVSIITPTHDTRYLKELEEAVLSQIYKSWEWIILLNGGAKYESHDPRIRIEKAPEGNNYVGRLKKYACSIAQGEIIIEADHDDLLTGDCLEEIVKAFDENTEAGFVYSDCARMAQDAIFTPYLIEYGWQYGRYRFRGKWLWVMKCQPLYPGRLGYIWFAPDHVRAWRKDIYDEAGGHDESLPVCDDQDLMHRLYLITKFHYIEKVLYIYRISGLNTWRRQNDLVQDLNKMIYDRNIERLAERFCELNGLQIIDFGNDRHDYARHRAGSAGLVKAWDALYLRNLDETMKEIHRLLAPGGLLMATVFSGDGWEERDFWPYCRKSNSGRQTAEALYRECHLETCVPDGIAKERFVKAHLEKL